MNQYTNLVIGGAGVKNYASIGAIEKIKHIIPNIKRILGVSSGSLISTLLAIGCSAEEIKKYYDMVDLEKFKVKYSSWYTYYKIFRYNGIYDSKDFRENVLHKILEEKTGNGNITFGDIYEKYDIVLVIPAACTNKREMHYYHHVSNKNMPVKYAIERSSCVPGLFYPIKDQEDTLVDAGLIDNYPFYFFDKEDYLPNSRLKLVFPDLKTTPNSKTLGILIIDDNVSKDKVDPYLGNDKTKTLSEYIVSLLNTLLTTNSRANIGKGYWENTIAINIGRNIDGVTNMVLDEKTKIEFYNRGLSAAEYFLI